MSLVEIEPGEVRELIQGSDASRYLAQLFGADVQVGQTKAEARTGGVRRVAGDEGELEAGEGTPVHVYNDGDATATLRDRIETEPADWPA